MHSANLRTRFKSRGVRLVLAFLSFLVFCGTGIVLLRCIYFSLGVTLWIISNYVIEFGISIASAFAKDRLRPARKISTYIFVDGSVWRAPLEVCTSGNIATYLLLRVCAAGRFPSFGPRSRFFLLCRNKTRASSTVRCLGFEQRVFLRG